MRIHIEEQNVTIDVQKWNVRVFDFMNGSANVEIVVTDGVAAYSIWRDYNYQVTWEDADIFSLVEESLNEIAVDGVSRRSMSRSADEQIKEAVKSAAPKLSWWKRFVLWIKRLFKRK